jgi:hypothetical protein
MTERSRDYLMLLPAAVIYFGLWLLLGEGKAYAAAVVFGVFYVIISRCWDRRSDVRFWVIIGVFAFLHIGGLWLIDVPHVNAGLIALPFALVDGLVMWAILNWIETHFPNQNA